MPADPVQTCDCGACESERDGLNVRVAELEARVAELAGEAVEWMPKIVRQDTLAQQIADILKKRVR